MVEAYLRFPEAHEQAAQFAGVSVKNAKTAWNKGWGSWGPPISRAVADRLAAQERRRREVDDRLALAEEGAREQLRAENEAALRDERRGLAAARKGVLAAGIVVTELVPSLRAVVASLERRLFEVGPDGRPDRSRPRDLQDVTPRGAIAMVRDFAQAVRLVASAEGEIMALGRLERGEGAPGEPGSGGNPVPVGQEMSAEEARSILTLAGNIVEMQAEPRGLSEGEGEPSYVLARAPAPPLRIQPRARLRQQRQDPEIPEGDERA